MSSVLQTRVGRPVSIAVGGAVLHAEYTVPPDARALVLFAHGSGSSRSAPATRELAHILNDASLATLACDLLTREEEVIAELTGEFRADSVLLTERLRVVLDWCAAQPEVAHLPIGVFAAGSGVDAAVITASIRPDVVKALVLRTGRIERAWASLPLVDAATLFVAGAQDTPMVVAYGNLLARLVSADKQLLIVPRAGHLFDEPGARAQLGEHAANWFTRFLVDADVSCEPC